MKVGPRVARLFHPLPPCAPGIHPTSVVAPSAIIHETAEIGPFCVIGEAAEIGAYCRIGPYVSIGAGVSLGADCRIGSHASLSHAVVGERVYIYPGARIGQEGFSFANTKLGFLSIPQLGRVVIGDDVEVGANSTIDRGSVRDTMIGAGSRLDNLVQIGHNVQMGPVLRDRGAGGDFWLDRVGGFRPGRRPGCHGRPSAYWPRGANRRPGRGDRRCGAGCNPVGQSGAVAPQLPARRGDGEAAGDAADA